MEFSIECGSLVYVNEVEGSGIARPAGDGIGHLRHLVAAVGVAQVVNQPIGVVAQQAVALQGLHVAHQVVGVLRAELAAGTAALEVTGLCQP